MVNYFYKTPTKLAILALIAGWLVVTVNAGPVAADEREPLMDLRDGGIDFFIEIVPSIVQIYNGGIRLEAGGSAGSGYMIDREGHAITNKHVADNAEVLEVAFFGDEEHTRSYAEGRWAATIVAEDPALDLAVLKIDAPPERFHPVRLGDSSLMQPGDTVATFGSPGGDPGFVDRSWIAIHDSWLEFYNINLGVIAEVMNFQESFWVYWPEISGERAGDRNYGSAVEYMFHTDSAINHGNSGGPVLNVYGEAVGTNTWGFDRSENLGFSVPVNLLKRSVADILEYGRVRRPWCGISLHPTLTPQQQLDAQWDAGTYPFTGAADFDSTPNEMVIYEVNPYAPAYEAGLRPGDIILRIDGQVIENVFDVYSYILSRELGDEMVVEYERDGHGMTPAVVTISEKLTRYYGVSIDVGGFGPWTGSWTRYSSHLTY